MQVLKCPSCNANLTFENDSEFVSCEYCGTRILLDDFAKTERIVDEARIKESDNETKVRLKELEIEQQRITERNKSKKHIFFIFLLVVIIAAIIIIAVVNSTIKSKDDAKGENSTNAIAEVSEENKRNVTEDISEKNSINTIAKPKGV